jgi:hypothetical protein
MKLLGIINVDSNITDQLSLLVRYSVFADVKGKLAMEWDRISFIYNVKAKMSLCTIKHHATKTHERVGYSSMHS